MAGPVVITVGPLSDEEASAESWFCPACGQRASVLVGKVRLVTCTSCRWVFDVRLHRHLDGGYHASEGSPCALCGVELP